MKRLKIGILYVAFMLVVSNATAKSNLPGKTQKPNVIVILVDDMGYADVGFNGCNDIPTPNIDRIANSGVKFTNGYVTYPVCGPSRAGLITGRYQDRFGSSRNPLMAPRDPDQGLPLSEETMADVLKRAGYASVAIGKWHLGAHRSQWPLNRGFDEFFGFLGGGHNYFPEMWTLKDLSELSHQWDGYKTKLMRNNARVEEDEYLTDALSREAVNFVDRYSAKAPFFIYLAYNAPHSPMQATEKYLERFNHISNKKRKTYAAMVSAVDDGVGLLLNKLSELDELNNSIVIFLSDNGGPEETNGSDNGHLREGKSSLYDGGIHVPFAIMWPGKIPEGISYDKPVISLDIMATVVENIGAETRNPLDGKNLLPYLTGQNEDNPHDYLFWKKFDQQWSAVRGADYKLLNRNGVNELFKLKDDPGETSAISTDGNPNFTDLQNRYSKWDEQMVDPAYLGLMQDKAYTSKYPDRFKIPSPFSPDNAMPFIPKGYKLVWSDEFNTDGKPNEAFWSYENGFVRNQELQWYQPDNATVENGVLLIEGRREKLDNPGFDKESNNWKKNRKQAHYSSASIKTVGKFDFKYGILEVRARIDTSSGSWPAIWTLGIERPWPDNGEIDIMEYYRHEGIATILANAAWKGSSQWEPFWDSEKIPLSNFIEKDPLWPQKFHVWKMVWTENSIRLYLDETLLNETDVSKATYDDGFNPFRQPHYILLNLALGAHGGNPDISKFPLSYEVDYVRVYQIEQ